MNNKKSYIIIWMITFLFSCIFIYKGNQYVSKGLHLFDDSAAKSTRAEVLSIVDTREEEMQYEEANSTTYVTFLCRILEGNYKGKVVEAQQVIESNYHDYMKLVESGDKIIVYGMEYDGDTSWHFGNYVRSNAIILLAAIFLILVLIIGRSKGVNTIVSLMVTCLAVFFIFVPSVLNGYNVYVSSLIISMFTIITTLLFVNGISKKSIATMLGCTAGVTIAAISTFLMGKMLHLTGMVDEESYYLTLIDSKQPIDIKAIIFGCIIIGALGAIMDIAMDIASSLSEVKKHAKDITFTDMLSSGMSIGRDVIGTMSNTLVLAYIGSSLSSILLLMTYSSSIFELINREVIIVDLLQALIGSLSILLTIPFTAFVCALLYSRHYEGEHERE